ncbi:hypothetical protein CC1G_09523 [Coprinopsis cinerea okayama7|uniref:Pyrroloquinoline quinone-dependent pyranose dehydrogenase beta-propeller domain-containing protein n=1 Tax=Coprinopsis cinerea (strain Okayama-7 / 130 / ATCC MYA-4618 / FGSC 9003) TaxID=240176 RepID=A8P0V1_COPC7|nr:hypothetical protein CC1G_09523 [Coprinopsis cinerea okayama7\|eukprot:XP_001837972.2 hypothetical protein CC1G_09523 [Coprinopsis cinerea okayama7\
MSENAKPQKPMKTRSITAFLLKRTSRMGSESARLSPNSEMHMQVATVTLALWLALLAPFSLAQSICSGAPQPRYPMTLASGWRGGVLLGGLTMPRGIMIDTRGNLLVIQRGRGLTGHALDANGCVTSTKTIIQDSQINHAIDVHPSGNRIMASSGDAVWSWDYDPVTMTATNKRTLITGMNNFIHFTRTIHISRKYPNLFALSVGSESNVDPNETAWIRQSPNSSIRLQQSPFSKSHMGGYWENSLDDAYRMVNGQRRDIHTNNPAEKVYNYPNGQYNDAWCNTNAVKPTALLPPHTAPLDMKFGLGNDTNLYVGLHGSWNRQPPQGYKVVIIPGRYSASGEWSPSVGLAQTKTSFTNLLTNRNENQCSGSFGVLILPSSLILLGPRLLHPWLLNHLRQSSHLKQRRQCMGNVADKAGLGQLSAPPMLFAERQTNITPNVFLRKRPNSLYIYIAEPLCVARSLF